MTGRCRSASGCGCCRSQAYVGAFLKKSGEQQLEEAAAVAAAVDTGDEKGETDQSGSCHTPCLFQPSLILQFWISHCSLTFPSSLIPLSLCNHPTRFRFVPSLPVGSPPPRLRSWAVHWLSASFFQGAYPFLLTT